MNLSDQDRSPTKISDGGESRALVCRRSPVQMARVLGLIGAGARRLGPDRVRGGPPARPVGMDAETPSDQETAPRWERQNPPGRSSTRPANALRRYDVRDRRDRGLVLLTGSDPIDLLNGQDEDLPVADVARASGGADRVHARLDEVVGPAD